MKEINLSIGQYVAFFRRLPYGGEVIGRVLRIQGRKLTVILSPFGIKGKKKGKRLRIERKQICGVLQRRKVIPCHT